MWKKSTPLRSLRIREGDWWHSEFYTAIHTCHDWGYKPSEFGLCLPEEDLSIMAAYTTVTGSMRGWEATLQEKEIEKARNKT